jgi:hypothetical protein
MMFQVGLPQFPGEQLDAYLGRLLSWGGLTKSSVE